MTKYEMLDAISGLGYYPYNSEFDSYEDIRKELQFLTEEVRRTNRKKLFRGLFGRD